MSLGVDQEQKKLIEEEEDDIINCMLETAKNPTIITGNVVKTREGTTTAVLLGTADGQTVCVLHLQ